MKFQPPRALGASAVVQARAARTGTIAAAAAGIVIATPAETHAEQVERALEAGKDVLCEKPLALRYEDARRVHELALRRGRILMVGHILEYHPAIRKLQELIRDGQLGRIR